MSLIRSLALITLTITSLISINLVYAEEEIKVGGRKIVGGEPTDIDKHPWQVALQVKTSKGTFLCGGSIIAFKWVLTAAHCFSSSTKPSSVRVKAGATNYQVGGNWTRIEMVVRHPRYNPKTEQNDIALIKLKSHPKGKLIPLANTRLKIQIGQPLEVTGWGATSEDGDASRGLLKASVPYVDNSTCNKPASYNGTILKGMMCAGRKAGGIDACQGDSGGPLILRTSEGPVLVGVVSFGIGCARKLKYGVYTRVSNYRSWIRNVITERSGSKSNPSNWETNVTVIK